MKTMLITLALPVSLLAACSDDPQEVAQDQMEASAEQSAVAAGPQVAALGLTELQLLDADVFGVAGEELGEVQQIVRNPAGEVTALLVEIEDSSPDRFVELPLTGMTVMQRGNDADISATMTRDQLMAMPEVVLPVR